MFSNKRIATLRGLICFAVVFSAGLVISTPARAAFHLWQVRELYSNSSGTVQFIELFTTSNSQTNFSVPRTIVSTNVGGTLTNTFTLPIATLAPTLNKSWLFGTAGVAANGGPTPDHILPNNFLFTGGGSINLFNTAAISGTYAALPTNGILSRNFTPAGINNTPSDLPNSPTNFSGTVGTVPEPTSLVLVSLALGGIYSMSRRRKSK
jgi:serralysin